MDKREHWGSNFGFILAASGSAVGLGNIWKYPYIAGENGGGAFTLIYLLCILIVGMPIVIGEFVIGRKTQLSPVGAFEKLAPKSFWKWVGMLGVCSAFVILAFYGVVGGWTLRYTFMSLMGDFSDLTGNPAISGEVFNSFITNPFYPLFWHFIFMGLCIWVIINGIKGGIEKWTKIMMPMILFILIILVFRGITLPNASAGISFLFKPKFEDITASSIVLALGHSFFTLSLGMGTMITYGSYLKKEQNLFNSAMWVLLLDTGIAIMAGIAIFTTVFSVGADPAGGPGLIFVVLPTIFPQIAGGLLWGTLFFFLLFLAALTSAISILEVVTAYFIDQKGWTRSRATIIFGLIVTACGVFCSLSLGDGYNITEIFGIKFFDFMDNLSSKYMLPLGGLLTALFILVRWGIPNFLEEFYLGMTNRIFSNSTVKFLLTIASIVVGFIILNEVFDIFFGIPLIGKDGILIG